MDTKGMIAPRSFYNIHPTHIALLDLDRNLPVTQAEADIRLYGAKMALRLEIGHFRMMYQCSHDLLFDIQVSCSFTHRRILSEIAAFFFAVPLQKPPDHALLSPPTGKEENLLRTVLA